MTESEARNRLIELQFGYLKSGALYVVSKLGIPDRLADGEAASDAIATALNVSPSLLYRVMRFLAGQGVFSERPGRVFALTPMGDLLRSTAEKSLQPFVVSNCERGFEALLELLGGVVNGQVPFERRFGKHNFSYLREHPEKMALMERGWQGLHWPETQAILDSVDFEGTHSLADIGGGHGDFAVEFLRGDSGRTCTLFDLPAVASHAANRIEELGLLGRCSVVGGDFFNEVPVSADAYFMRHILHDWNDRECIAILKNIAARCEPGSRVLIAEYVVGPLNESDTAKLFDMVMLLFLTGCERTEQEYQAMLESAGFEFVGVTATPSMVSVIEGRYPA